MSAQLGVTYTTPTIEIPNRWYDQCRFVVGTTGIFSQDSGSFSMCGYLLSVAHDVSICGHYKQLSVSKHWPLEFGPPWQAWYVQSDQFTILSANGVLAGNTGER